MTRRTALDLWPSTGKTIDPTFEPQLREFMADISPEAVPANTTLVEPPVWRIIGTSRGETLDGLVGYSNIIEGLGGDDTLNGQENNDFLYGGTENDILVGRLGNDLLSGDEGEDTMTGGPGDDGYGVDNYKDVVVELENEGLDTVYSFIQSYTLPLWVERLVLI